MTEFIVSQMDKNSQTIIIYSEQETYRIPFYIVPEDEVAHAEKVFHNLDKSEEEAEHETL